MRIGIEYPMVEERLALGREDLADELAPQVVRPHFVDWRVFHLLKDREFLRELLLYVGLLEPGLGLHYIEPEAGFRVRLSIASVGRLRVRVEPPLLRMVAL